MSSHSENEESNKKNKRLFGLDLLSSSKQNSAASNSSKSPAETTKKGHQKEGKGGFHFKPRKPSFHGHVDKSKSAVDLSHIGQNQPTAMEEMQVKMASEASRRAEEDRMRRLRLQEEQELAYAIALSKAEAASLKKP